MTFTREELTEIADKARLAMQASQDQMFKDAYYDLIRVTTSLEVLMRRTEETSKPS